MGRQVLRLRPKQPGGAPGRPRSAALLL